LFVKLPEQGTQNTLFSVKFIDKREIDFYIEIFVEFWTRLLGKFVEKKKSPKLVVFHHDTRSDLDKSTIRKGKYGSMPFIPHIFPNTMRDDPGISVPSTHIFPVLSVVHLQTNGTGKPFASWLKKELPGRHAKIRPRPGCCDHLADKARRRRAQRFVAVRVGRPRRIESSAAAGR